VRTVSLDDQPPFEFVGCSPWHSKVRPAKRVWFAPISRVLQIPTKNFTAKRRPITRKKLAAEVAKSVNKFIAVRLRNTTSAVLDSHATTPEGETEWPRWRQPTVWLGRRIIRERVLDSNNSCFHRFVATRDFRRTADRVTGGFFYVFGSPFLSPLFSVWAHNCTRCF